MFKNYLKITFRNILKYKAYSYINIAGLAIGMTCTIMILFWVQHELSYDRFHENGENIYRVTMKDYRHDGLHHHPWLPFPLARALEEQFPEIVATTRLAWSHFMVKYKDKICNESEFCFVDPPYFKIFSFPLTQGDPSRVLSDPKSIVITDKMAKKYFEDQNPVGKILTLDNEVDFRVSGVVHIPGNSDQQCDFYLSFGAYQYFNINLNKLMSDWRSKNYHTYVLLRKNSSAAFLENKIAGLLKKHNPDRNEVLTLQELTQVHLYNPDGTSNGITYVYVFSIIAVFILLIACVNFMNLATACSEKRAKEVGLRKTAGAKRSQLVIQFFTEAILLSLFAFFIAIAAVEAFLPVFNEISGKELALDLSHLDIILGLIIVVLLTGIFSGSYPALFLSSFKPVTVLKGLLSTSPRRSILRNCLVIFQFALSVILIACTCIVYSQLKYIQTKDLGLDKEHLVYILMEGESKYKYETVKKELLKHPGIINASACHLLPANIPVWAGYLDWEGKTLDTKVYFAFSFVDFDYIPTFRMQIKEGRNFSREFPADANNYIINEEAVRQMGLKTPIGTQLDFWGHKGEIIGVVKDFNFRHLGNKIAPLVLSAAGGWGSDKKYLAARINPGNPAEVINHFRQVWKSINPNFSFDYHFFDETYDRLYMNEQRLKKILFSFSILAIFISCLGLFGLASFMAERRSKEIGIRKVLGATVSGIVLIFSGKFIKWVLISNIIAWPAAYYLMSRWLQNFAYRTDIHIGIFIFSGLTALVISLLSLSYQSIKAATANPVEVLRYE